MNKSDFLWGTATASFQVEGASHEDGRADSIWDVFCRQPGSIADNSDGSVACDHYHRCQEDVQLIADLGCNAYRFSIAWPRIIPQGSGKVNQAGIDFYNRLIDALLEKNIQPFVTLYHWDLPAACHYGWLNGDVAASFANYAKVCFDAFGDRVHNWITFNESRVASVSGYGSGIFAPGIKGGQLKYIAAHNMLRGHALAVREFREGGYTGQIGITNNCNWREPASPSPEDLAASQHALEYFFGWFADPMMIGDYPEIMRSKLGTQLPQFTAEEKKLLLGSLDFLGLNHYASSLATAQVQYNPDGTPKTGESSEIGVYYLPVPDCPKNDMGWCIDPPGLRKMLNWLAKRYNNMPVYITENGCAAPESDVESAVNDVLRQQYIKNYIAEALKARNEDKVNLCGYFYWTLLDNFEWSSGYLKHFGLVRCSPQHLERIKKGGYYTYKEIIRQNR